MALLLLLLLNPTSYSFLILLFLSFLPWSFALFPSVFVLFTLSVVCWKVFWPLCSVEYSQALWPMWREGSTMFSLWQDRQRCLTLCKAQLSSALHGQRGMSLINSALWSLYVLTLSFSVAGLANPDNATGSSFVESELSVISPHFLLVLSSHFSTLRVYRIVIIECYAQLPLSAPYAALTLSLHFPPSFAWEGFTLRWAS